MSQLLLGDLIVGTMIETDVPTETDQSFYFKISQFNDYANKELIIGVVAIAQDTQSTTFC